jgi:hypothetical protein
VNKSSRSSEHSFQLLEVILFSDNVTFVKERKLSQVVVFCVVTPCANVVEHQRFGGPYCLHLQSEVWRGKLNEKIYVNFWGLFA